MYKFGRIITNSKTIETLDIVDVTKNREINHSVPTLIVGKQLAEEMYGKENIHFLDKKLEDNVYWTFSKLERRNDFEKDIDIFNKMILKKLLYSVNYEYLNPFTVSYNDIKNIILKIRDSKRKVAFIDKEHLYILYGTVVYGVSFVDLDYIGIKKSKVLNLLNKNNVKILENDNFISKKMKKWLNDSKIMVPYMYFLQEN